MRIVMTRFRRGLSLACCLGLLTFAPVLARGEGLDGVDVEPAGFGERHRHHLPAAFLREQQERRIHRRYR